MSLKLEETRECPSCDGRGLVGDYVGLEMRCVGVECSRCLGSGVIKKQTRDMDDRTLVKAEEVGNGK